MISRRDTPEPSINEQKPKPERERKHWLEYAIFLFVVATAGATGFAAYYTKQQWLTADDVEYRSLRGSITLNDFQIIPAQLANTIIGYLIIPKWQNVGETSATGMTFRINYQFSRDDLPLGFTSVDGTQMLEGPADVAPKETLNVGGIRDASGNILYYPQSCWNDMLQGKFRFAYLWGWAKYHDVFKPNNLRVTRFCRRLYGTSLIRNEIALNQYLCQEGNCQDEACEKYNNAPVPRLPSPEACQLLVVPLGAQVQIPTLPQPPATPVPPKQ